MASNQHHGGGAGRGSASDRRVPEWADGLKQLYDSVVEEDLPDAFRDLLDKLDGESAPSDNDNERGGTGGGTPSDGRTPRA